MLSVALAFTMARTSLMFVFRPFAGSARSKLFRLSRRQPDSFLVRGVIAFRVLYLMCFVINIRRSAAVVGKYHLVAIV